MAHGPQLFSPFFLGDDRGIGCYVQTESHLRSSLRIRHSYQWSEDVANGQHLGGGNLRRSSGLGGTIRKT